MAEVCINLPEELKLEIEESNLDLSKLVKEIVALKLFEKRLSESATFQRVLFESIVSKSKLTQKQADELADKVSEGMFKRLKEKYSEL